MNVEKFMEGILLDRLKTKTVTQIFVSDLIAEAGICKATFYTHYCDKYDLLQKCFDHHYYNEVLAHAESFEQFCLGAFAAFRKTPKTVLHAMAPDDAASLFGYHSELVRAFLLKDRRAQGKGEDEELEYVLRFFSRSVTQVTVDWLSAPRISSAEDAMRLVRGLFPASLR